MENLHSVVRTEDVIGVDVKNTIGEDLGNVKEIILDKLTGEVRYVVLSFGDFLGLGGKLFAIPWKSISYDDGDDCFVLNVDKEKLKNAPGFDKDNWPDFSDKTFLQSVNAYYSQEDIK